MSIDRYSIEQAHERIKPYIHRTPVLTSKSINEATGCHVYLPQLPEPPHPLASAGRQLTKFGRDVLVGMFGKAIGG